MARPDAVHPSDRPRPRRGGSAEGDGARRRRLVVGAAVAAVVALLVAVGVAGGPGAVVGSLLGFAYVLLFAGAFVLNLWYWWSQRRLRSPGDGPPPASGRSWLEAASVGPEGLLVPGSPARHACDLALTPRGIELTAGWTTTTLSWDHHRRPRFGIEVDAQAHDPSVTGWSISAWSSSDTAAGVAVAVGGTCLEQTTRVRGLTRTWRTRLASLGRRAGHSPVVPLVVRTLPDARLDVERELMALLCELVARRPVLREHLSQPERLERLLGDLRRRPLPAIVHTDPVTRKPFEVAGALGRLGFAHPLGGRPLPDERLVPLDEVVSRTLAELRRSPYTRDLGIEAPEVAAMARQRYLVEPWPFSALLADTPGDPGPVR